MLLPLRVDKDVSPMTKLEMSGMKARGDDFANVEPVLAGYR
jgi:hypothetical protein